MKKFVTGDIVRVKNHENLKGLFEVTGAHSKDERSYYVTNDDCFTEHLINGRDLMFVCSVEYRQDIDV